MENDRPEGTKYQYVTYTGGEALGKYVNLRGSNHNRKTPQRFDPGFEDSRKWNSYAVATLVYMIKSGDYDKNIDTDEILSLMAYWDAEDSMDAKSRFHNREFYVLRLKSHNPNTQTYMVFPKAIIRQENPKSTIRNSQKEYQRISKTRDRKLAPT